MSKITVFSIILVLIFSCTTTMDKPENWSEKQLNSWFEKQEWMKGWTIQPHQSINKRSLAVTIFKNQERWEKVFNFLKSNDLSNMEIGRYEIQGDSAFALISEYISKNREDAKYESHQKYIDIQYLIDGEELIGVTPIEGLNAIDPYNPEKDFIFYDFDGGEFHKANPASFFVFFPNDAHRPGVKVDDNIEVKKLVVKIKVD